MAQDDHFDHPTNEATPGHGLPGHSHEGVSHTEGLSASTTIGGAGLVPMAEAITIDDGAPGSEVALTPNPEGPGTIPGMPSGTIPQLPQLPQLPGPQLTYPKYCNLSLPGGCYRLSFRPKQSFLEYRGTLRVDRTGATPVVSGDLYRFLLLPPVITEGVLTTRALGEGDHAPSAASGAVGSISEAQL